MDSLGEGRIIRHTRDGRWTGVHLIRHTDGGQGCTWSVTPTLDRGAPDPSHQRWTGVHPDPSHRRWTGVHLIRHTDAGQGCTWSVTPTVDRGAPDPTLRQWTGVHLIRHSDSGQGFHLPSALRFRFYVLRRQKLLICNQQLSIFYELIIAGSSSNESNFKYLFRLITIVGDYLINCVTLLIVCQCKYLRRQWYQDNGIKTMVSRQWYQDNGIKTMVSKQWYQDNSIKIHWNYFYTNWPC